MGEGAEPGEYREQQDGPGEDPNPAIVVAEDAENDAADHRADQCPGDEGACLRRCEMQLGGNGPQHEAENEQVESVHRIADGGGGKCLTRGRADAISGLGKFRLYRSHHTLPS
jgi:hypothetical protein